MNQETARQKHSAIRQAEQNGEIADSMDVRKDLLRRVKAGEITLAEAQEQLKKIKRNAKATGKTTRAKVWSNA